MLRRDLIMKQIEEMARALAVILGLRKSGNNNEARQKMDELINDFLRTDLASLNELSGEELVQKLYTDLKLHQEQVSIVADCFMQEGEMQSEEGNIETATAHFSKALHLFESLNKLPKATFSLERMQKIKILKERTGKT
jgi:hypothetical protein